MKNLVVSCIGRASTHRTWLPPPGIRKSFDLLLIAYEEIPKEWKNDSEFFNQREGFKFQNVAALAEENPNFFSQYEHIWIPDDDIISDHESIARFFSICEEYHLDLAQPGLGKAPQQKHLFKDIDFMHRITCARPGIILRRTTFVEVMMPLFSTKSFSLLLPTFSANASAWGLDAWWAKLLKYKNIGIVDATPMIHSRKVGSGDLYLSLAKKCLPSPRNDLYSIFDAQGFCLFRRTILAIPCSKASWRIQMSYTFHTILAPIALLRDIIIQSAFMWKYRLPHGVQRFLNEIFHFRNAQLGN